MRAPKATVKKARALRREPTFAEILLWQLLRGDRLASLRFRRRYRVGPYVLDFFCTVLGLAVEVDGAAHDHPDRVARRAARPLARRAGVGVLRFPARDLLTEEGRQSVLATIAARAEASDASSTLLRRSPSSVSRGRNSPVSLDSASAAP